MLSEEGSSWFCVSFMAINVLRCHTLSTHVIFCGFVAGFVSLGRMADTRFSVGQLIRHIRFGYRGVIFDVDPDFQGSNAWYEQVARSRPPKDQPWYHVLPDGSENTTYVAERNLDPEADPRPLEHPMLDELFMGFENGSYRRRAVN